MYFIFFAVVSLSIFQHFLCQQCPAIYLRYCKEHSYCKPRNPNCPIYHTGVTDAERNQIVDIHNENRSFVATGKEKMAGGLPTASDMLQMVWDLELAAIAQKRAEQCIYAHDCINCRKVENFDVGQNIASKGKDCIGAEPCNIELNSVPDWPNVIKTFFDEVANYNKRYLNSTVFFPGNGYSQFTQMIWAKTWRIGCGFVAFRKERGYRQLYICNYGPRGNIRNTPVYKVGNPCSSCPINSCCDNSCKKPSYDGLCRLNSFNEAPIYQKEKSYIFYCNFSNSNGDCSTSVNGLNQWKYIKALGGSFAEIVLSGGQNSTLVFKNTIQSKQNFCMVIIYRRGPTVDGRKASNTAVLNLEMSNLRTTTLNLPSTSSNRFFKYSIILDRTYNTKVSVTFSVPSGAPEQFLNIKRISAAVGEC